MDERGRSTEDLARRAIEELKGSIARAGTVETVPAGHLEAKVHRTIHLLREAGGEMDLIMKFEQVSCLLREMSHQLGQGRVNAYASGLLRLRRAAERI